MRTPPSAGSLPADANVLVSADAWLSAGRRVWLATVVHTYGSAPRPVGSMAAIDDLGHVAGSVSGGCVEDHLVDRLRHDTRHCDQPRLVRYGVDADDRDRLRLPCNGHIEVWLEPLTANGVRALLARLEGGRTLLRTIDLVTGASRLEESPRATRSERRGDGFHHRLGPGFRLVMVGAGDVSRYLAPIALSLGFRVDVVEPREEYLSTWPVAGCHLSPAMPDDFLASAPPDAFTAVVALSHDPRLDELALIDALASPLLYVGALGSARTTPAVEARLALFDISPSQQQALRRPVGAPIGAKTAPQIAVAIAADLVAVAAAAG
jgi:xanthine dehydrogenase accessory factor